MWEQWSKPKMIEHGASDAVGLDREAERGQLDKSAKTAKLPCNPLRTAKRPS